MTPAPYSKLPVTISAMQWWPSRWDDFVAWISESTGAVRDDVGLWHSPARPRDILGPVIPAPIGVDPYLGSLTIETLEGRMAASPGDWVIRGVQGEFYPCRGDIFSLTYEPA